MKALLILLMSFTLEAKAEQPIPAFGKIVTIKNFKSVFVNARDILVWLPENYEQSNEKFAVLYMHDGQMLFDSTITWNNQEWQVEETMTSLLHSNKIRKTIVVGIPNAGPERHAEFTPQIVFESLPESYRDSVIENGKRNAGNNIFSGKIKSDNYLKFIVSELKPYVDEHFRTLNNKENTFIAGSSMGGLISLYAICEYPEVFGAAACLSTHWPVLFTTENNLFPEAINQYLVAHLPSPEFHRIYFDYGDQTLDAIYKPYQLIIDETMVKRGFDSSNWKTLEFPGDDHSERSWAKRLHVPLEFLLGK